MEARFGVSPAFVVSLFGTGFSVNDYCTALDCAQSLGFSAFQPEIFTKESLPQWINGGATQVARKAQELDMAASQFVAHFLLEEFATPEKLRASGGQDDFRRVLEMVPEFTSCRTVTIPMAPFQSNAVAGQQQYLDSKKQLADKLLAYADLAFVAGFRLAVEILPFSLIGGIGGFLEIGRHIGTDRFGINLDTGHAWACRELVPLLPCALAGRVFGLHLKDNHSTDNLSLAPGKGSIPWKPFLANLAQSGYSESFDIEIGCPPADVPSEYLFGRDYLAALLV